jgi:biopolymer transport protein ExbD
MSGRRTEDRIVFFEAEDDVPYGLAVAVLDSVKGAGVATLGMMTPNKDDDSAAPAEGASAAAPPPL